MILARYHAIGVGINPGNLHPQGSRISNLLDLRFSLARLEADRLYAMA
jgi:hypothetical protein